MNNSRELRSKYPGSYMLNSVFKEQAASYSVTAETHLQGQNQILVKYPPLPLKVPGHYHVSPPHDDNEFHFQGKEFTKPALQKEFSIDRFSSEWRPCVSTDPGSFVLSAGLPSRLVAIDTYNKKHATSCRR